MLHQDEELKSLNKELKKHINQLNLTPKPVLDNLSPMDMSTILHYTFDEDSPIAFKEQVAPEVLAKVPFLNLAKAFLNIIKDAGEIKLTKIGNLPRKVVLALYAMEFIKDPNIESGLFKLYKEEDVTSITHVKIISFLAKLTKKRHGKMSLTKKGLKLLENESSFPLFKALFLANCQTFNLGYHDGYPQKIGMQSIFGYTMYLLLRYGREKRKVEFYSEKYILAFPKVLDSFESGYSTPQEKFKGCYHLRYFSNFLVYYGLEEELQGRFGSKEKEVKATDLFYQIFELKPENFQFIKHKNKA